jgi:hypothetical protein
MTRSLFSLGLCLWLSLSASACGSGGDASAGVGALGGAPAIVPYAPADWTSRCAAHLGDARLCRELSRAHGIAQRERAALALNVASAPSLGALHFSHGCS